MTDGYDLNAFYRLKATLARGNPLSVSERSQFRVLGKLWKRHYRMLHDSKGVRAIERDLKLLERPRLWRKKQSETVETDVLK